MYKLLQNKIGNEWLDKNELHRKIRFFFFFLRICASGREDIFNLLKKILISIFFRRKFFKLKW